MIPRSIFRNLTTVLVVLTVMAAIVNAFHTLLAALGDLVAARVVRWIGVGCLVLLCVDLILLVGALGLNAAQAPEPPTPGGEQESGHRA